MIDLAPFPFERAAAELRKLGISPARDAGGSAATLIAEIYAPAGPAAGITILW
jgi:hypothetical protein